MAQCQMQGELLVAQHPKRLGHGSANTLYRDLPAPVAHAVTSLKHAPLLLVLVSFFVHKSLGCCHGSPSAVE